MKVIMVCSGGMSSAMVVDSIKKQAIRKIMILKLKRSDQRNLRIKLKITI